MLLQCLAVFERLLGDPCSGFVLAVALHAVAAYLIQFTALRQPAIRSGSGLAATFVFLVLCYAEYRIRGPQWFPIIAISALRAWIVFSAVCIVLSCSAMLHRRLRLVRPKVFQSRTKRSSDSSPPRPMHSPTPAPVPPPPPSLPPEAPTPTFEEKAALLRTKFNRCCEELRSMPIPEDECEARIRYLKSQLDERLNQLIEEAWS